MATQLDTQPILQANLASLRLRDPALAERVEQAPPAPVVFSPSRAGPLTATVPHDGHDLALASRYDPLAEAGRLTAHVNLAEHAAVVVLGMGLGYHAAELARRMDETALLLVYEPDAALLRAVLERVDHHDWLGRPNVLVCDGAVDRSTLTQRVERFAGMLTQGTVLVTHPPSRQLHGQRLADFGAMLTEVLAYCRTNIATALVNAARTTHNLCMNLAHYAAGAGTDELHHLAPNTPAVCVGAGPSLARNIHLLRDPAVRRRVVVIAAQTALKPLVDRGIEPDFVTALDYSEISRRFYESLPRMPNVTLVAEPLAHPAILDAFTQNVGGPVRVTPHRFLQMLLGRDDNGQPLLGPAVPLQPGATVAHLSFYLAQHLGCDPVIFTGQDLGFSDGLYYCPGTAIHDVWLPELGAFNTLEMMEWQRIVRHRGHLQKRTDVHGRDIYSDEQMLTYLKQFERDFARAGQTIIDASEGGLPKEHSTRMTLAEALDRYATRPAPPVPRPPATLDDGRLFAAKKRLGQRIDEVTELRRLTQKTVPLLRQMLEHQRDRRRFEALYDQMQPLRRRVEELSEAFAIVSELNTIGVFRRARADRAIDNTELDELARQARRIERDLDNLDFIAQACDEALAIFTEAQTRLTAHPHPSPLGEGLKK